MWWTEVHGTVGLLKSLDLIIIIKHLEKEAGRFFRTLKRRTKAFANNINARKLHIHALNAMLKLFFTFYNFFRFHKGMKRIPSPEGRPI